MSVFVVPMAVAGAPVSGGQHPGRPLAGGTGRVASFVRKHAAATAIKALDEARPRSCSSSEVGREGHIMDLAPVELSVEAPVAPSRRPVACSN